MGVEKIWESGKRRRRIDDAGKWLVIEMSRWIGWK